MTMQQRKMHYQNALNLVPSELGLISIPQTQPSLSLLLHSHGDIEFSDVSSPYVYTLRVHQWCCMWNGSERGENIMSRGECMEDGI